MRQLWGLSRDQVIQNAELDKNLPSSKVFILGTGRAGTHWVSSVLESHPEIRATVEEPEVFFRATKMALDESKRPELFPELVSLYQEYHESVLPCHYVDKSHPNIWLAGELAEVFPTAKFVGVQRGPFATVASMLRHKGVQKWMKRWREFPVPNPFLGIDESNAKNYGRLSLAAKCTLRWKSHASRMERLQNTLGHRLLVVDYEGLGTETEPWLLRLQDHLQLSEGFVTPEIKTASLTAWDKQLTRRQKRHIEEALAWEAPDFERRET